MPQNIFRIILNREDLWDLYMRKTKKYWGVYSRFVRFQATKKRFILMRWQYFLSDKVKE